MIPLKLAMELKEAGLLWRTENYDFFAIPERGLDDRVYILADMMAYTELVQGWPVVAFHGTAEWALDYILTSEVVWIPTEEQLRETLEHEIGPNILESGLLLKYQVDGYVCQIVYNQDRLGFPAETAGEAYGLALLHVLKSKNLASSV
jgi:hypothetical protein